MIQLFNRYLRMGIKLSFFLCVFAILACSSAPSGPVGQDYSKARESSPVPSSIWETDPLLLREQLMSRDVQHLRSQLLSAGPEFYRELQYYGEDSLYAAALLFQDLGDWQVYTRLMSEEARSGSLWGRKLALEHILQQESFSKEDKLALLLAYTEDSQDHLAFYTEAAELAFELGNLREAQKQWTSFARRAKSDEDYSVSQRGLGLRLALSRRNYREAEKQLSSIVLDYSSEAEHKKIWQDLEARVEWRSLLASQNKGAELLQMLDWKVQLLEKRYNSIFPVIFAGSNPKVKSLKLKPELQMWWEEPQLVADSARALYAAKSGKTAKSLIYSGFHMLELIRDEAVSGPVSAETRQMAAYWLARNERNPNNLAAARSLLSGNAELRSWLLVEYLYDYSRQSRWAGLPQFMRSWRDEAPQSFILNTSSKRLLSRIYHNMMNGGKVSLLREMLAQSLEWQETELILDSAWALRVSSKRPLSKQTWQSFPSNIHQRAVADMRLFVLRADQEEVLLPVLNEDEPQLELGQEAQIIDKLLQQLLDYDLNSEALRIVRAYYRELPASVLVNLGERMQAAGDYSNGIRVVSPVIYNKDYPVSKRALRVLYPEAFNEVIDSYTSKYKISKPIFYGLVRQESYFMPAVVSRAGAVGLSQLMPATMKEVAKRLGYRNPDATDPRTNVSIGSSYLRYLIDHRWINNLSQALMAYNAGLGNLRKWTRSFGSFPTLNFNYAIPILETRDYVPKVGAGAIYYASLYSWGDPVKILAEIYPDEFRK